jgi:hypothetical protein
LLVNASETNGAVQSVSSLNESLLGNLPAGAVTAVVISVVGHVVRKLRQAVGGEVLEAVALNSGASFLASQRSRVSDRLPFSESSGRRESESDNDCFGHLLPLFGGCLLFAFSGETDNTNESTQKSIFNFSGLIFLNFYYLLKYPKSGIYPLRRRYFHGIH